MSHLWDNKVLLYCIVLYCIALHCIVLYWPRPNKIMLQGLVGNISGRDLACFFTDLVNTVGRLPVYDDTLGPRSLQSMADVSGGQLGGTRYHNGTCREHKENFIQLGNSQPLGNGFVVVNGRNRKLDLNINKMKLQLCGVHKRRKARSGDIY